MCIRDSSSVDPARARRRFDDVLALAPVALGIRPDHVFAKTRRRDKGGSQYRDAGRRSYVTQVDEDGYLMEVDPVSYTHLDVYKRQRPTIPRPRSPWRCRARWTRACTRC